MTGTLEDVAMLASSSPRSRIYLDLLERESLLPREVLVLEDPDLETPEERRGREQGWDDPAPLPEDPDLDPREPVGSRLERLGIPHRVLRTLDPNADEVAEALGDLPGRVLVYSGPGGAILRPHVLSTFPRFLHVHAGVLPDYRGSTTVYYSILRDGTCGASAFLLEEDLDAGPVVARRTFPLPRDRTTLDLLYDPWIRGQVLVEVLASFQETGDLPTTPQSEVEGETYHIVHPVLKHAALHAADPGLDHDRPGPRSTGG